MTDTQITGWVMASVTAGALGWDIYVAAFNKIPNIQDTISGWMKRLGRSCVAIPLLWGGFAGHFWGPRHPAPFGHDMSIIAAGAIVLALSISHLVAVKEFGLNFPSWSALVYCGVGAFIGAFFWPM